MQREKDSKLQPKPLSKFYLFFHWLARVGQQGARDLSTDVLRHMKAHQASSQQALSAESERGNILEQLQQAVAISSIKFIPLTWLIMRNQQQEENCKTEVFKHT